MASDFEYRVGKLELRPGDCVVARFNEPMTMEASARLRSDFERNFPGQKVLIIDNRCDLSVMTKLKSKVASDLVSNLYLVRETQHMNSKIKRPRRGNLCGTQGLAISA